jgi:hypothetical protein
MMPANVRLGTTEGLKQLLALLKKWKMTKEYGTKWSWDILEYYYRICLKRLRSHDNLSWANRPPGQQSNLELFEYEARVLTNQPRLSVQIFYTSVLAGGE